MVKCLEHDPARINNVTTNFKGRINICLTFTYWKQLYVEMFNFGLSISFAIIMIQETVKKIWTNTLALVTSPYIGYFVSVCSFFHALKLVFKASVYTEYFILEVMDLCILIVA